MDARQEAPFGSVEAAWFSTMRAVHGRKWAGTEPVGLVLKCLDGLYRKRQIELVHARILKCWGLRGRMPNPSRPRERSDWRLWREAMMHLEPVLRDAGLVAGTIELASLDVAD